MNEESTQPESTGQEAEVHPVAESKLGFLNQDGLKGLLDTFLNEGEELAPAPAEQQETPEEPDSSEEEIDQSEEESDQQLPDESSLSKGVQKRINKLVAARKAAESQLEENRQKLLGLEKELESARSYAKPSNVEVSDYVSSLETVQSVNDEYKKTIGVLLWCKRNPDGGVLPVGNREVELTMEEVRELEAEAIRRKELELPERYNYLQQKAQHDAMAEKEFPWLSKPETEEYKAAQMVLKEFPELKRKRADYKHVAGLVVLGLKAYNEMKAQKPAKPSVIKKAPPQPSVSATPSVSSQANIQKAKQRFVSQNSDRGALNDLIKEMGLV